MRKRQIPLRLSLSLLAVLLAACAPAQTQSAPAEVASPTTIIASTATPVVDMTATPPPTVQAVATSRGPNLEATDPKTVSMAAGGLQFVEFFEFW